MNKILFYITVIISIIWIPFFAFAILNISVSKKHELISPDDCISLANGQNLCIQMNISFGLFIISIILPILLLVNKNKIIDW